MSRGYLIGVGLGLGLIAAGWLTYRSFLPLSPIQAAFATNLIDRSSTPVTHGHTNQVVLKVQNHARGRIQLQSVRFNQSFVHVAESLSLPLSIPAGDAAEVPVEIRAEESLWGPQEVQVSATVAQGRQTQDLHSLILWDIAAHINPSPPVVEFQRVRRTDSIQPIFIRLWAPADQPMPEDIQVQSLDPAVAVTMAPLNEVRKGRHYVRELTIQIDARLAQPQHRSQIVVRTKGGGPPVIIPVVGWVDE